MKTYLGAIRQPAVQNVSSNDTSVTPDDAGFGLVEIVIAMLLLGVVAISFLPVLVRALTVSAQNVTIATATQLVNDQLDDALATVSSCAELTAWLGVTPAQLTDSQNVDLQPKRSGGNCDDTELSSAVVTVTVARVDTSATVASATTLVGVSKTAGPGAGPSVSPSPAP